MAAYIYIYKQYIYIFAPLSTDSSVNVFGAQLSPSISISLHTVMEAAFNVRAHALPPRSAPLSADGIHVSSKQPRTWRARGRGGCGLRFSAEPQPRYQVKRLDFWEASHPLCVHFCVKTDVQSLQRLTHFNPSVTQHHGNSRASCCHGDAREKQNK